MELPRPSLQLPRPTAFHRSTRRFCSMLSPRAAAVGEESTAALVWFKHDLRIHDHPGLVAASSCRNLVPFYLFDHRILSRFSDDMLKHVLLALKDLKKSLNAHGSDLVIGFGPAENAILELVNEVKATHIFAEHEVEHELCQMLNLVKKSVASEQKGSPKFVLWRTPFFDFEDLEAFPRSYQHFQKLKLPLTLPISSPSLPVMNFTLDRGSLPTYDDLKHYISINPQKLDDTWVSKKAISAQTILKSKNPNRIKAGSLVGGGSTVMEFEKQQRSFFFSETGQEVAGGTDIVLDALDSYLRYLEGTSRGDWQELHEKVRSAESRKGTSFRALFGPALKLGAISRRQVHSDAIKYEKDRNAGFLNPFGYSAATVGFAVEDVMSMEWYWLLALKNQLRNKGKFPARIWNWNGYLVEYTMIGDSGPAVLLVHGFGAFFEHYRDNLPSIANGGNQVWAITLLGFGNSEKPNILYNELVWAELLRDFIIAIIGEPAHLIGNSIGGYAVSIVAGFWPSIVKSVILINSAGSVKPGYSSVQFYETEEASSVTWLGARLLMIYLRLRAKAILKNCYPSNPGRVDDWLANEVIRASFDPGALIVLENIFGFNLSIPLNYLFEEFQGKVLVIQGMRDPITNSKVKVSIMKEHCPGITIKELDAGHCPHDEKPDEVNLIICEWIVSSESSNPC